MGPAAVLVRGTFSSRGPESAQPEAVYDPGCYAVRPDSKVHTEANAGGSDLVGLVFVDGPIDFVPAA